MAESPIDRLKRLAAEKRAALAAPVAQPALTKEELVELVTPNTEANLEARMKLAKEKVANEPASIELPAKQTNQPAKELESESGASNKQAVLLSASVESSISTELVSQSSPVNSSSHPLAEQFLELETALIGKLPEFKTILRQIHRHLGQEPELVTQMTEKEIQMVVQGLIVFANAEIVEPAKTKTDKAKIAAAKKVPISVDDL